MYLSLTSVSTAEEPNDESPTSKTTKAEPIDESPTSEYTAVEPNHESPISKSTKVKPKDESARSESTKAEPNDESSTSQSTKAEPKDESATYESTEAEPNDESTYPKFFFKDLNLVILPKIVDILVVDTSKISEGCVSVISTENKKQWNDLHMRVQENQVYAEKEYQAEMNEICLVKRKENGAWYRAECLDPIINYFCFIDYGNDGYIDPSDIRKIPIELRDPCYTAFCKIRNCRIDVNLTMDLLKQLTDFLELNQHKNCGMKLVGKEFNWYKLSLPELPSYYHKLTVT